MTDTIMPPVHPGEILLEEFLAPLGVSQYQLAKAVHVPARRINEIVHGQRRITADTALRLSRYFGTSERFWSNCQYLWIGAFSRSCFVGDEFDLEAVGVGEVGGVVIGSAGVGMCVGEQQCPAVY
jgi:antitoxin HigA-1